MLLFICGTLFGVFLEQNYDLPNILNLVQDIRIAINKHEKIKEPEKIEKENEK